MNIRSKIPRLHGGSPLYKHVLGDGKRRDPGNEIDRLPHRSLLEVAHRIHRESNYQLESENQSSSGKDCYQETNYKRSHK